MRRWSRGDGAHHLLRCGHCTSSYLPSPGSGLPRRSQANSTETFQCWPSPAVPAPQVPFSRSTGAKCQTSFRANRVPKSQQTNIAIVFSSFRTGAGFTYPLNPTRVGVGNGFRQPTHSFQPAPSLRVHMPKNALEPR